MLISFNYAVKSLAVAIIMSLAVVVGMMIFWGNQETVCPNANLIGGRYPNFMISIMFNTGSNVPSREGMWRPRVAIFGTFMKKNFNTVCV